MFKQNEKLLGTIKKVDGSVIRCFFMSGGSFRGRNISEHGYALNEKKKLKTMFGLREKQFKNCVFEALSKKNEDAFQMIVKLLESRLDNAIFRLGFAATRASGRQMVNHGHILVNEKKVNIPSYRLKIGDKVSIKPSSLEKPLFKNFDILLKKYQAPSWLKLDKNKKEGSVLSPPCLEAQNEYQIDVQAIIEFYLK